MTVVLNGKSIPLTIDANDQVKLTIPTILCQKYPVTITYVGDEIHVKSTATANVIVKKTSVKLTLKKKSKKYTVTLKNNKGKVMKKVKLTLSRQKTFKVATNKKGKATFNLKKLTKKAKYTAKLTYKGDKYFNKLTKKVKIIIKK